MLIVNEEHRIAAGIKSLSKRCPYCSKSLKEYPLIMNDDAGFPRLSCRLRRRARY